MTGTPRALRAFSAGLVLFSLSGLVAACASSPSSPGVASLGKGHDTTVPAPAATTPGSPNAQAELLAYSFCMRAHGVPKFPDPGSGGGLQISAGSGINPNSPTFIRANSACQHFLPNGGKLTPAQQQAQEARFLKLAQCMRSHGVPNFPTPNFSQGHVSIGIGPGLDPSSPQFQAAAKTCGLPTGGPVPK